MEFAKGNKRARWDLTLMTDELDVEMYPTANSRNDIVWARSSAEVPAIERPRWGPKVKLWAGACARGKTQLYFYEGTLDGEAYRELLAKALKDMKSLFQRGTQWVFQHDGASAHKDRLTNDWLRKHVPKFITSGPAGKWPPNSPDLNWIEDLWGILKEKLKNNQKPPTNVAVLKRRLRKAWKEIPLVTLQKCAASMPGRLQEVIQNKGEALRR